MATNGYYLVDISRGKRQEQLMRLCEIATTIVLYHNEFNIYQDLRESSKLIAKYWKWEGIPPSGITLQKHIRVSHIKWFMANHFVLDNGEWNSDFIFGLMKCGKILQGKRTFSTFSWQSHFDLVDILKASPYSGKFSSNCYVKNVCNLQYWKHAAVLSLPHREDTEQFMAGVMAVGKVINYKGSTIVSYSKRMEKYFIQCGIPIEKQNKKSLLISPIWPSLFSIYMPEICKKKFIDLKNPFNAEIYCPILWRSYVSNDFIPDGIPYLRSRRSILYDHKCEMGAFAKLDQLRLDYNLTILDNKVINCVRKWSEIKEKCV